MTKITLECEKLGKNPQTWTQEARKEVGKTETAKKTVNLFYPCLVKQEERRKKCFGPEVMYRGFENTFFCCDSCLCLDGFV